MLQNFLDVWGEISPLLESFFKIKYPKHEAKIKMTFQIIYCISLVLQYFGFDLNWINERLFDFWEKIDYNKLTNIIRFHEAKEILNAKRISFIFLWKNDIIPVGGNCTYLLFQQMGRRCLHENINIRNIPISLYDSKVGVFNYHRWEKE